MKFITFTEDKETAEQFYIRSELNKQKLLI